MYEYGASADGTSYAGETNREALRHVPIEQYLMTFPHAANVIDTMCAKLCKPRIDPMVITEGANWFARKRARDMQRAMLGEFNESQVDAIKEKCVFDMLVPDHGAGFAMVSSPNDKVQIDYVPCEDLYFDEAECRYGEPRSMFRRWKIDRYQALEMFATDYDDHDDERLYGKRQDRERAILNAPRADLINSQSLGDDQIILIEAWHLRSGPHANDGRHAIVTQDCTLLSEPYERDRFQVARMVGLRRPRSIWGVSIMRKLAPAQREHDIATTRLQQMMAMSGTHIAIPRGANIDSREIDNGIATIFEYDGAQPPISWNPDPANAQFFNWRSSIPTEMRQSAGFNDMSTSGQVPAGLSNASGKALRVFQNAEDQRLILFHRAIERWVVDLCWLVIDEVRDIMQRKPDYSTRYVGKNTAESLKWKELLKDKDDFAIRVAPASALSNDPSGRIDDAEQLFSMGIIDKNQVARLVDMGADIQEEQELSQSPYESLRKKFDTIIEQSRYVGPIPHDDLATGIKMASAYINKLETDDNFDEMQIAVEMLNQWIVDAQSLIEAANPPPPMPMPPDAMGAPPGEPPMPMGPEGMPPMPPPPMGGM
jgi:hypothetical protein